MQVLSAYPINLRGEKALVNSVKNKSLGFSTPFEMETKGVPLSSIRGEEEVVEEQNAVLRATKSTHDDAAAMRRMGKTQELVRNFRLLSLTSFTGIATVIWELGLFLMTPGLVNGGRAGLIWNLIWNFIGFTPIYLSMAEMASIAPIAGAQYHWVSEFAPESCQQILSYITGWTSSIAWQAGNAVGPFLVGTLIQTIWLVNNENYAAPAWQGTLFAIAAMAIAYILNRFGARWLSDWQVAVFILHIGGYLAYLVPIWVNAPKATHRQVWTEFENTGGWSSIGFALLVGQFSGITQMVGVDTAAHMSEETKDASWALPRAILSTYFTNVALVFTGFVTVCYAMPNLEDALNDPTTYPAVYVLRQSVSVGGVTAIMVLICFLNTASNVVYLAAVSRDLFAFARDRGLPFSNHLSKVDQKQHIPLNATNATCGFAVLLSLIYIGSPVAFYAITSLGTVALLQCYAFSIGCMLWRRIKHPQTVPPARFSLGRFGVPMNAAAVLYSTWAFFWSFWPVYTPVTAADLNWAGPIFGAVLVIAGVYFVFVARHKYSGPVVEVMGRHGNADLS